MMGLLLVLGLSARLQDGEPVQPAPVEEPPPMVEETPERAPGPAGAVRSPSDARREVTTEIPPEVADQLVDFETEKVMEVQRDAVQVRVMGSGRVGTIKIRDVKTPVLGRHRHVLTWPEFYERVGRKDLARQWARLTFGSAALSLSGLVASFGSALPFLAAMLLGLGLVFYDKGLIGGHAASSAAFSPLTIAGIAIIILGAVVMTVMILGGAGLLWASREMPEQPVDNADIVALADEYNHGVVVNAGLPETLAPRLAP